MSVDTSWRLLVLGCGSAGSRWIELAIEAGLNVYAYDIDKKKREAAKELGARIVPDIAAGLRKMPHGVIIATWPTDHIPLALRMVRADCHALIEKPLSHNMDGVVDLARECEQRSHLAVGVVCNLRYHPTTTALRKALAGAGDSFVALKLECGSDLTTWRQTPYTQGYGPWRERGGGVALDAIHELDLACHLLGAPESAVGLATRTGQLIGDSEDVAAFVMRHRRGLSEVHLDYLQTSYWRRVTLVTKQTRTEFVYEQDAKVWRGTYLANLKAWVAAASGAPVPNPVSEAARTLEVALGARNSERRAA